MFSRQRLAIPMRLRVMVDRYLAGLLAPFVFAPARLKISGQKGTTSQVPVSLGKVGHQTNGFLELSPGLVDPAQRSEVVREIKTRDVAVWLQTDGRLTRR